MNQTKVIFRFGDTPFQKIRAVDDGLREEVNQSALGISASSSTWLTCGWYSVSAGTVVTWNALLGHNAWQRYANATGLSPYSVSQFPFETVILFTNQTLYAETLGICIWQILNLGNTVDYTVEK